MFTQYSDQAKQTLLATNHLSFKKIDQIYDSSQRSKGYCCFAAIANVQVGHDSRSEQFWGTTTTTAAAATAAAAATTTTTTAVSTAAAVSTPT